MSRKGIMKSNTLYIIYFAIGTRILSFIKGILTASKIGVNYKMDSYLLALGAIMLLTKIIGEGIIVSLIPLLQEIQEKDGTDRRIDYTNNLINTTVLLSFILIVIGYFVAPVLIKIFGPGFKGKELQDTIVLFRIGLPIITVSWIRSIGAGFLQSDHAFRAGAKGGISNAVVYIIYLLFFSKYFGLKGLMITGIIAVISQIYIIMKAMEKKGYKYEWRIDLKDRYLPRVIAFLLPIIAGIGINELNNAVDNAIASTLSVGSIAELNYADEIITLFLGIFTTAIVTVIFPRLSECHNKKDEECVKDGIHHGIFMLFKIAIPVSIVLITMAEPIVKIVFERGAFDAEATFFTSGSLSYYAVGLTAMAIIPLITRAYYAIHDMKTPVLLGTLALGINIVLDLTLSPYMGASGLALGTSIGTISAVALGIYDLNKRLKFTQGKEVRETTIKLGVASVIMATGIILTYGTAATTLENIFLNNIITVGISTIVGAGLYTLVFKVLRLK